MHKKPHKLAGQTVKFKLIGKGYPNLPDEGKVHIEDWADRVFGKSWGMMNGNPTAMIYGVRAGFANLPTDDDVVYGKVGSLAYLFHVKELIV